MELAPQEPSADRVLRQQRLVRRLLWAGWGCLALSALFLYLSGPIAAPGQDGPGVMWAMYLMLARLCGIAAFSIGGVAIFNRRWFEGIALFLLSVVLPFIALQMHGTF